MTPKVNRKFIDFDEVGIGTALRNNRLAVPVNQREYKWTDTEIQYLFHDLAGAIDNGEPAYFLGTIVLSQGEDCLEVADGQQRLATTTILLAAIRDYFRDKNDHMMVRALEEFLFTANRKTREIDPHLRLNVDDNEFFKQRILHRDRGVKPTKHSHERIAKAAELAEEHIADVIKPHSEEHRTARLNSWVDYIEDRALVIVLKVADDLNAFTMFETLNDRGLRTSQADLVKSYLFDKTRDSKQEAQQKWASMNGTLESISEDEAEVTLTYLRHCVISLWGPLREKDLLKKIKDQVQAKQRALEMLQQLHDYAVDYAALFIPTHARWNQYNAAIRNHIRTLSIVEVTPMRPLMLAVVRRFPKEQTEKAFRLFVMWSARFLIVGGARTGKVEEAFAEAARDVNEGKIASVTKLSERLADIVPSDPAFELSFSTARISKATLARYYLRCLELKLQNNPEPEWEPTEGPVITLEHILPANPGNEWPHFDGAMANAYVNRIGNMVLLRASANSRIGNQGSAAKFAAFKKSTFQLTKEVGTKKAWGPQDIEERQKRLAKLAVETWPLAIN